MPAPNTQFTVPLGSSWRWPLAIRDDDGVGIDFTGAEISAAVWAGDDRAALFVPDADWTDITAGEFTLSDTGSGTSGLTPGRYPVQVDLSGEKYDVGYLVLTRAPGTAEPGATYCSADDVLYYAGDILSSLQEKSDQSTWQEPREKAYAWTHRTLLARLDKIAYDSYHGHLATTEITDALGTDPLLWSDTVAGHLTTGVVLDYRESIREANALYAASEILCRQIGKDAAETSQYRSHGLSLRTRAIRRLAATTVAIDTDDDQVANYVIPVLV